MLAAVGGQAIEARTLHAQHAAAVLIVVSFAAWLSHTMWRVVRARSRRDPEPERSHEVHELLRSWMILATGLHGALVMLTAAIGPCSVATGLVIAQGLGVAVLFAAGLVTATRRPGAPAACGCRSLVASMPSKLAGAASSSDDSTSRVTRQDERPDHPKEMTRSERDMRCSQP